MRNWMAGVEHGWRRLVRVSLMESGIYPLIESIIQMRMICFQCHQDSILKVSTDIQLVIVSQNDV